MLGPRCAEAGASATGMSGSSSVERVPAGTAKGSSRDYPFLCIGHDVMAPAGSMADDPVTISLMVPSWSMT